VLASPFRLGHPEAPRLARHSDGVKGIALEVD
jgi:hypothetical protein